MTLRLGREGGHRENRRKDSFIRFYSCFFFSRFPGSMALVWKRSVCICVFVSVCLVVFERRLCRRRLRGVFGRRADIAEAHFGPLAIDDEETYSESINIAIFPRSPRGAAGGRGGDDCGIAASGYFFRLFFFTQTHT